MIPINDIVVPVPLSRLKCGALESECPFPSTGFGRSLVFREGKLPCIVVPRAEEMDGLDAR
jgi:hypothetical protein